MKMLALISLVLSSFTIMAGDPERAHVMMDNGRVKFQFSIESAHSQGSFELRSLLEKEGYVNENGFVATKDSLLPFEIYNYLYDDGTYVFTIMLPPNDARFFVDFNLKSISFYGQAAEKLFGVVKKHLPQAANSYLEQYQWGSQEVNYCDKTLTAPFEYRCRINF